MSSRPDETRVEFADGEVHVSVPCPRDSESASSHVLRALRAGLCAAGLREHHITLHCSPRDGVRGTCRASVDPSYSDPVAVAGPEIVAAVARAAMDAYGYDPVEAIDYGRPGGPG